MAGQTTMGIKQVLLEALRTRSGQIATGMLVLLTSMSIVVPLGYPSDIVDSWSDSTAWLDNPRTVPPEWIQWFTETRLPKNIDIRPADFIKTNLSYVSFDLKIITLRSDFVFDYDAFPSELRAYMSAKFAGTAQVNVTWVRPDGENVTLYVGAPRETLRLSQDPEVIRAVRRWALDRGASDRDAILPEVTLFAKVDPGMLDPARAQIVRGRYEIRMQLIAFDLAADIDGRLLVYGKVYGWAGTDTHRRDLLVGVLWGAPVALAFGTVAAIVSVLIQAILGALGAFYGSHYDELVQRLADFFLILPFLPILIVISLVYSPGIWALLAVVIAFGVFGGTTKVVRSIVLQVKEELYVEVAKSYGLSRSRILFRHIIPRTLPYTFALIALSVPVFIFLEASVSFLGLGDPVLPTWGKIIGEAYSEAAMFHGWWWWITYPIVGILFATVAFALLGYAFDTILNPRLREE